MIPRWRLDHAKRPAGAPPAGGGPPRLPEVERERRELLDRWRTAGVEESRLREELVEAWVNAWSVAGLLPDMKPLYNLYYDAMHQYGHEHEDWFSGRIQKQLAEMQRQAQEIVMQLTPEVQARYNDAWANHLQKEMEVRELESRLLAKFDLEIQLRERANKDDWMIDVLKTQRLDIEREAEDRARKTAGMYWAKTAPLLASELERLNSTPTDEDRALARWLGISPEQVAAIRERR